MKKKPVLTRFRRWCDGRNVLRRMAYRAAVVVFLPLMVAAVVIVRGQDHFYTFWDDIRRFCADVIRDVAAFAVSFWRGTPQGGK